MAQDSPKRQQPIHIPLSFKDAVRGLLAVDPKQLKKRTAKKKVAKKAGKKG
jgi:hypothetical protein